MSVPREELLFLVQQNGGDFSKVRKFFDEFSLSLSLSGFCCRFSSNSSHPGKRQRDRETDRQTDRQTYVSVSLSVSFVWYLKTRIWWLLFPERELRPPSNYYPIIGGEDRENRQTDRQTDRRMSSLSVCLSVSFVWYLKKRIWCRLFPRENWDPPPQLLSNNYWRRRRPGNLITHWDDEREKENDDGEEKSDVPSAKKSRASTQ